MIFIATTRNGDRIEYRDRKRWLWILSVLSPSLPGLAAVAFLISGNAWWVLAPIAFYYGVYVVADHLVGVDPNNPPEDVVEAMASDTYYRVLLFLSVPVFWFSFLACAIAAGQPDTGFWAWLGLMLGAGVSSGTAITVGHELGHKTSRLDRWGAKFANAISGYGHFCIEHNRGHHIHVATPEDPASARLGESLWRFAVREIPGTAVRGWRMERARLAQKGLGFWHWRNDILQGYAITLVADVALIVAFGWTMVPFLLLHNLIGWFHLTTANYIEHYGLKRELRPDGRYGPCEPRHSWNTNHIITNLMLFHLQRHSDHHANPLRPYQALRSFDDLPTLPSGYPGTFLLAAVPRLWFRVMDPKVMAWADGDLDKTNLDPSRAAGYRARWPATASSVELTAAP
ncbi:alkane 1-monooxygenase [Hoeflea sp. YIM 152468]|uniref:alkane 1-monooxygenase n=1 Tax=Hoeflea sp. YIM 152468 TaxID=3031759 RepID=UPI0023D978D1|nr:alkane 1-monooxygenase [Hoeflea sp. YIM 152468]MDF1608423.1 alkane 1-monooxygenase [Hoeflea sp. YIM 152468]